MPTVYPAPPALPSVGCEELEGLWWSPFLAKRHDPAGHIWMGDTLHTEPRAWSRLRFSLHRSAGPCVVPARDSGQLGPAGWGCGNSSCRHCLGELHLT